MKSSHFYRFNTSSLLTQAWLVTSREITEGISQNVVARTEPISTYYILNT